MMLYQARGIRSSPKRYFVSALKAQPPMILLCWVNGSAGGAGWEGAGVRFKDLSDKTFGA